jgi:hypothetical protein
MFDVGHSVKGNDRWLHSGLRGITDQLDVHMIAIVVAFNSKVCFSRIASGNPSAAKAGDLQV